MQDKYISKQYLQTYFDEKGFDAARAEKLVNDLASKGYVIEGFNEPTSTLSKAKTIVGGMGSGVGAELPLAAIDYLGKKALSAIEDQDAPIKLLGGITAKQALSNLEEAGSLTDQYKSTLEANKNPELYRQAEIAGTVAGLADLPVAVARGAAKTVAGQAVKRQLSKGVNVVKEGIAPTPTIEKALGEVSVAKKVDQLEPFKQAVQAVETKDVKTFDDLYNVFNNAIPAYAKKVDAELSKDAANYTLDQLAIAKKTAGGKEIKIDYISKGIEGLKDFYKSVGDDVNYANMLEVEDAAKNGLLTRTAVNNLARKYNEEIGSKAFDALGNVKTGVSAQGYEQIRSGLKEVARQGLGGAKAQELDRTISSLYDARALTKKNVDAVNALKQRIEEKGWVGTAVRNIFEISDIITGGAVRAIRDTVLARGSAQKLQNIFELEKKLEKNLKVLQKAVKAKTEDETTTILKQLTK